MSNALAIRNDLDLGQLGSTLAKSGYFTDVKDAAQAVVKVLAGQELGIGPVAAMTGVYLVNGRVAIGANLMAAAVKRSGRYNYRVTTLTDDKCAITFTEGGQSIGESVFTMADAKRAGTKNIDKFPRNMLFARAMSNGVRWFCPDVFQTAVYTPEELRGGDSVIEAETIEATPEPTPAPADRRTRLLARIANLTSVAEERDLEIILNKSLDEMSEDELIAHGKALAAAIEQASVIEAEPVAA